jgi:hypothetical protein
MFEKLFPLVSKGRMKKANTMVEYPVTGIIIANEWDMNGNVTNVAFYADNEEIYLVGKKTSAEDLLTAVQKRVRIIGNIFKLSNGRNGIDIKSFEIVKGINGRFNKSYV